MNTEKTQEEIKGNRVFQESRRIIELEGQGPEDLLSAGLSGRERSIENVVKLWKLVFRTYQATMSLPAGRCKDDWTPYWNVCSEFLQQAGWSAEQLEELRYTPKFEGSPSPSIDLWD
jgi:hypothetical protein